MFIENIVGWLFLHFELYLNVSVLNRVSRWKFNNNNYKLWIIFKVIGQEGNVGLKNGVVRIISGVWL